jgi:hypothetical protein
LNAKIRKRLCWTEDSGNLIANYCEYVWSVRAFVLFADSDPWSAKRGSLPDSCRGELLKSRRLPKLFHTETRQISKK